MNSVYLDLHAVDLYGWEKYKFFDKVDSFMRALDAGEIFSPLFVRKIRNRGYTLDKIPRDPQDKERADGGHHRALAHYFSHRPLLAIITDETPFIPSYSYLIKDLGVVDLSGRVTRAELLTQRNKI